MKSPSIPYESKPPKVAKKTRRIGSEVAWLINSGRMMLSALLTTPTHQIASPIAQPIPEVAATKAIAGI
jgi:hypothetical protein